jgi:hypothetical protein
MWLVLGVGAMNAGHKVEVVPKYDVISYDQMDSAQSSSSLGLCLFGLVQCVSLTISLMQLFLHYDSGSQQHHTVHVVLRQLVMQRAAAAAG